MKATGSRIESDVENAPFEAHEHIVPIFAVVLAGVEAGDAKSTVEDLFHVGEIIAVLGQVPFALAVIPGTASVFTHSGKLHDYLHTDKRGRARPPFVKGRSRISYRQSYSNGGMDFADLLHLAGSSHGEVLANFDKKLAEQPCPSSPPEAARSTGPLRPPKCAARRRPRRQRPAVTAFARFSRLPL